MLVAALFWPVVGLVAWVLWLKAKALEADKGRTHEVALSEAQRLRIAKDVEDSLREQLAAVDGRVQRLESRAALSR